MTKEPHSHAGFLLPALNVLLSCKEFRKKSPRLTVTIIYTLKTNRVTTLTNYLPYSRKVWRALNLTNWLSVGISEV